MSTRGHLDRIEAFEFAQYLCLVGGGTNPTLGWTNWLAPISSVPNVYEFLQEPPNATVFPVAMPFQVTGIFMSNGVKEVVVRHLVNAKPTDMRVPVRPISQNEEAAIAALMPASMLSYLRNRGAERTVPRVGATYSLRLGTVDVPFACGAWNNPQRARRYEVYLDVDALFASPTDVEKAVLSCLKQGTVATRLATLLTAAGWKAGSAAFHNAIEASLLVQLGDRLVNVCVTATSHCLEAELPAIHGQPLHAISIA